MRRVLIILLCFFLLIDVVLALIVFKQDFLSRFIKHSITINTVVPSSSATFTNKRYLDDKLNELGFWNVENVIFRDKFIRKVSVDRLNIELTNKPQSWGKNVDASENPVTLYSYGQRYDAQNKLMKLTIHVNPVLSTEKSPDESYSYSILLAIFDLTQPTEDTLTERENKLKKFLDDFFKDSSNNSFVKFKNI